MNLRRMMGQTELRLSNSKSSKSILTYHFSPGHNFSCLWHIGLKFYTPLDESCRYKINNNWYIQPFVLQFSTPSFFETPVILDKMSQGKNDKRFQNKT